MLTEDIDDLRCGELTWMNPRSRSLSVLADHLSPFGAECIA